MVIYCCFGITGAMVQHPILCIIHTTEQFHIPLVRNRVILCTCMSCINAFKDTLCTNSRHPLTLEGEVGFLGFVQLPQGADWKSFASVCMLCGIGLTVSIFIADLSYATLGSGTTLLSEAKLGILCGSLISAIAGCLLLNKFLPQKA